MVTFRVNGHSKTHFRAAKGYATSPKSRGGLLGQSSLTLRNTQILTTKIGKITVARNSVNYHTQQHMTIYRVWHADCV